MSQAVQIVISKWVISRSRRPIVGIETINNSTRESTPFSFALDQEN